MNESIISKLRAAVRRIRRLAPGVVALVLAATALPAAAAESEIAAGSAALQMPTAMEARLEFSEDYGIPVKIWVDGQNGDYRVNGPTVGDALRQTGITLGEHDTVNYALLRYVESGDQIVVERRHYATVKVESEIPFDTESVPTSLLADGKKRIVSEGAPGMEVSTWRQLIVDGQVMDEELLDTEVTAEPVTQVVMVGSESAPVSPLDFEYEFDESGEPVEYEQVLRDQRAAAYSAPDGAKTASGAYAQVGYVAVNPNTIPYGSKLYICSPDGRFVYGYAVAADTGTSLMQGIIGVDLFYDTYSECVVNGIRTVDIYILDIPE